jgi:hypothetical protein
MLLAPLLLSEPGTGDESLAYRVDGFAGQMP